MTKPTNDRTFFQTTEKAKKVATQYLLDLAKRKRSR